MAITFKEIAEIVGVSRTTVDRVIYNRGNVSPEVEKKVREVAKQYGFKPNHMGRALAKTKNPVKIGILVHMTGIPFFKRVLEGVEQARSELSKLGGELIVYEQETFDPKAQINAIKELVEKGIQGIAITPAHDVDLSRCLNELIHDKKIPIVTFNTDIEGVDRIAYVGVNNEKFGRVGAYLMDLLLRSKHGKVLLISGFSTHQTNLQRIEGFVGECASEYPQIEIVDVAMNSDDEDRAYDITKKALEKHPDIAGIFMVSSGQPGCCRALIDEGRSEDIKLVVVDSLFETDKYLKEGVIDFIVDQNAFDQGYKPPIILFDQLFSGKKPVENEFFQIGIKARLTVE